MDGCDLFIVKTIERFVEVQDTCPGNVHGFVVEMVIQFGFRDGPVSVLILLGAVEIEGGVLMATDVGGVGGWEAGVACADYSSTLDLAIEVSHRFGGVIWADPGTPGEDCEQFALESTTSWVSTAVFRVSWLVLMGVIASTA